MLRHSPNHRILRLPNDDQKNDAKTYRLSSVALQTLHFGHLVSIERVILLFVMTQPALVNFLTAR